MNISYKFSQLEIQIYFLNIELQELSYMNLHEISV